MPVKGLSYNKDQIIWNTEHDDHVLYISGTQLWMIIGCAHYAQRARSAFLYFYFFLLLYNFRVTVSTNLNVRFSSCFVTFERSTTQIQYIKKDGIC